MLSPEVLEHSFPTRDIVWECISLRAWSWTLFMRMESAPHIRLSLKFLLPRILSKNLEQTLHFKFSTIFFPPSIPVLQSNQDRVWHSWSRSCYHLRKVPWVMHLFPESATRTRTEFGIPDPDHATTWEKFHESCTCFPNLPHWVQPCNATFQSTGPAQSWHRERVWNWSYICSAIYSACATHWPVILIVRTENGWWLLVILNSAYA